MGPPIQSTPPAEPENLQVYKRAKRNERRSRGRGATQGEGTSSVGTTAGNARPESDMSRQGGEETDEGEDKTGGKTGEREEGGK